MHLGFSEILLRLRRQLMHMVLISRVCLSADEYSEQLSPSSSILNSYTDGSIVLIIAMQLFGSFQNHHFPVEILGS